MKITESPDGKFIVYNSKFNEPIQHVIPKTFLDEIIERGIPSYALEEIIEMYKILQEYSVESVKVKDLVGRDLTGKTLRIYIKNWEDSEWRYGENIATVAYNQLENKYELVPDKFLARAVNYYVKDEEDSYFDENDPYDEDFDYSLLDIFYVRIEGDDELQLLTRK